MKDIFREIKDIWRAICCLRTQVTTIINNGGGGSGVPPSYVPPTLLLFATVDEPGNYESGEEISPVLDITYTQNDAGVVASSSLTRTPGGTIAFEFPYEDEDYQVVDGDTLYQATVNYAGGPVKNDSLGNPYPTGQILAGALSSNILTYTGVRYAFWEAIEGDIPTNSAEVRALAFSGPATEEFIINIPEGTVHVVFAIPDTYTIDYVQYIELGEGDVKDIFDLEETPNVEGANAYSPIGYNVYAYTPVEPFPSEVNYRVKASAP